MLKFQDSPEVWALHPAPAPRGDMIYKNDLGEPVLRATRLGGYTLFTDARPSGEAVSFAGGAPPLRLLGLSPQALGERLLQALAGEHYYLQYLIYLVALRRFLRQRLTDFSNDQLGGAYYLFLRGMPQAGVYFARPNDELLDALDRLFTGASA